MASHECHASSQQSIVVVSASNASAVGSRAALFPARRAEHVAKPGRAQTVGQTDRMGRPSAKLVPEMEDEHRQNPIQTAGICEAEDADDCAEANAASAIHRFPRAVEEAHPAGSPVLRGTQWQAQRGVCLE